MLNVNTHIGEQAVHVWGRDFVFRPLFCRLAQLGSPKEIFDLFNQVQQVDDDGFIAAWRIMSELCDEQEIDNLIGYFYFDENLRKLRYVRGKLPPEDIHVIGCKLITDGVIGRPSRKDKAKAQEQKAATDFNPAEFVAIGYAHFGGVDWWNKTMIELQLAIKSSNPDKDEDLPTSDEIGSMFDHVEKANSRVAHG